MKIKSVTTQGDIFLAPLAGFTDAAFRAVCSENGASLCYTEMVSAKGLCYNNQNTATLCRVYEPEKISACQIFGSEPSVMGEAANHPALAHFHIIDINMGCPVPKVTKCGEGSALMKDTLLASKIIEAVSKATPRPVTVKFRRGYKGVDNAVEFAKMCEDFGAAAITVHPRFSEQGYGGTADYETTKKVKAAVKIPVIASGDIVDAESLARASEIADAVMIGRAAVGNPWIFRGFSYRPEKEEIKSVILRQIGYLERDFSERYILGSMRPHILAYFKTAKFAAAERKKLAETMCKIKTTEILKDFIGNL